MLAALWRLWYIKHKKGHLCQQMPNGSYRQTVSPTYAKPKQPLSLSDQGGYFCVLLLSLPIVYPIPKQVKPKLNTAISPKISIGSALLPPDSLASFYVSKIHCNRRVTVPPQRANRLPSWASRSRLYGEKLFLTVNNKLFLPSCL